MQRLTGLFLKTEFSKPEPKGTFSAVLKPDQGGNICNSMEFHGTRRFPETGHGKQQWHTTFRATTCCDQVTEGQLLVAWPCNGSIQFQQFKTGTTRFLGLPWGENPTHVQIL
jgi:hypothetical protein